jgi:hypothetical protein
MNKMFFSSHAFLKVKEQIICDFLGSIDIGNTVLDAMHYVLFDFRTAVRM